MYCPLSYTYDFTVMSLCPEYSLQHCELAQLLPILGLHSAATGPRVFSDLCTSLYPHLGEEPALPSGLQQLLLSFPGFIPLLSQGKDLSSLLSLVCKTMVLAYRKLSENVTFLRQGLTSYPGTHNVDQDGLEFRDPPASASQVLRLKACATRPGKSDSFK